MVKIKATVIILCVTHSGRKEPHDDVKAKEGTECKPAHMVFCETVEDDAVIERAKVWQDLGHDVELEYL